MTRSTTPIIDHDPKLDLVLERDVDVPVERVWEAWTRSEHVAKWFAPAPWTVSDCKIDLRPGGIFRTVMRSPEGEEFPGDGCILEVVPKERLVWTDALLPGYRPAPSGFFTCVLTLRPSENVTRYVAKALHGDEEARRRHEAMGFHDGWGTTLDQLVVYAKTM